MLDALEVAIKYGRYNGDGKEYLERLVMAVKEHRKGAPFREPTTPTYCSRDNMANKEKTEPQFYIRFFEACPWERECWIFFIPLTEKNLGYLNTLHGKLVNWKMTGEGESLKIDSGSRFKIMTLPVTREEALKDSACDAGGYMKKYNLLGNIKPSAIRHVWQKKDALAEALYKGGIKKLCEEVKEAA